MGALLDEIAPAVRADQLVISVAAGITTAFIERRLTGEVPVVRVMSNTPVLVDEAMSVISPGTHATEKHLRRAEELLAPGRQGAADPRVPAGRRDRAVGQRAGLRVLPGRGHGRRGDPAGHAAATALEMVKQAVFGAATMLRDSGEHPVILREAVTSPGGTTINAIRELERHGVRAAFLAAIEAARDRGRELGSG